MRRWLCFSSLLVIAGLAPSRARAQSSPTEDAHPTDHRVASALGIAATYATWGAVEWFALYHHRARQPSFTVGDEGWFSATSYAGGADKLGHFWANLSQTRIATDVLRAGGWSDLSSSLLGAGLCSTFFFLVEVKDGLFHVFSTSDLAANTAGALLAVAMDNLPSLDGALDVRVQWFPSAQFRRAPRADFIEDYSGESYLFALKLRALRAVREGRWSVRWLEFVNPVIGFQTRGYWPIPAAGDGGGRRQQLFTGVTIDLQALLDEALTSPTTRAGRWGRKVAHTVPEYVNAPFTTWQLDVASRSPAPP
jgi:hypothetical protein